MKISWFGHSCFCIRGNGITIITDPFDDSVGYRVPDARADVVLVSHEHEDHNNVSAVRGGPEVIRGPGEHSALGIRFRGVQTSHDDKGGSVLGMNIAFCFEIEGVRICHLGDLGEIPGKSAAREIGPVDLLFVPVGGVYTIDAGGADEVLKQLHPAVAVPMHYWTPAITFDLGRVDPFLRGRKAVGPLKSATITRDGLPQPGSGTEILLLDYIA